MKFLCIFLVLLCSCNSNNTTTSVAKQDSLAVDKPKNANVAKSYESLDFARTTIKNDTSNVITINRSMAIIILPDSTWSNKQQEEMGEDGWNEVVSDHDYYQSLAYDSLERKGISVKFFPATKQFYKFVKSNNSDYYVDRLKMKNKWGMILFNVNKDPVFWNNTTIDDAIKEIFEK